MAIIDAATFFEEIVCQCAEALAAIGHLNYALLNLYQVPVAGGQGYPLQDIASSFAKLQLCARAEGKKEMNQLTGLCRPFDSPLMSCMAGIPSYSSDLCEKLPFINNVY